MKLPAPRRASGFTLVELLVVIAIIAVLASAGFAAGNAAIQKAKRVKAQATAAAIESAVNNFFTEYGTMPVENLSADTKVDTRNLQFLSVLLGTETGENPLNVRGIKFLSVKEGKRKAGGGTDGIVYEGNSNQPTGLFDPWGGVFEVMLDGDYDERITVRPSGSGAQQRTLNGRRVAVWSNGADGVTGGGKTGDDVKTWD
jgi:prepilin-type N-terminal cleavage/methylation domain-containing protein